MSFIVNTSFLSSCFYLFPLYLHRPSAICFPAPLPLSPSHMYLMCSRKYILSYVNVFSMVTDILFNTSFSFCFLVLFSAFTKHCHCFLFYQALFFFRLFFFFFAVPWLRDLSSQLGIEPLPPAVETQSPNLWTTREFFRHF